MTCPLNKLQHHVTTLTSAYASRNIETDKQLLRQQFPFQLQVDMVAIYLQRRFNSLRLKFN